ncbi:MAG: hypothetical protein NTU83_13485, partial [Candidatus Hydrogenedentes bacterium]|nr:hypothetical protein [Candidatus Hydrogenedentota bacterium]
AGGNGRGASKAICAKDVRDVRDIKDLKGVFAPTRQQAARTSLAVYGYSSIEESGALYVLTDISFFSREKKETKRSGMLASPSQTGRMTPSGAIHWIL